MKCKGIIIRFVVAAGIWVLLLVSGSAEPALPAGLAPAEQSSEPALPVGLGAVDVPEEPGLPAGLAPVKAAGEPELPLGLGGSGGPEGREELYKLELPEWLDGFWELRGGVRLQRDPHEKAASIGESRVQLEAERANEYAGFKLVADLLYDPVLDRHTVDLKRGRGWLDLRQANLLLRPTEFMDLTVGRQINTWGTGDMLFINDLFPKDWNSYFIGRDDEYLKAPSDSLKVALFHELANLDIIYSPRFDSDRYIDGRRISYYNAGVGRRVGRNGIVHGDVPDSWFKDDEWALRLYRNLGSYEVAAYGYEGFWKSPGGSDPNSGRALFPRLQVFGGSARGPLARGIVNFESGWYRSADDLSGRNPFINNSEVRYLVGYEQELGHELTGGIQYYVEQMLEYDNYRRTLPPGMKRADEFRQVVTFRLTKLLMSQNLQVGAFVYYSPSDNDAFIRPKVNYKLSDHWIVEVGGNIFVGQDEHTFFGQFERNNNVYCSMRYGF